VHGIPEEDHLIQTLPKKSDHRVDANNLSSRNFRQSISQAEPFLRRVGGRSGLEWERQNIAITASCCANLRQMRSHDKINISSLLNVIVPYERGLRGATVESLAVQKVD
jgi:hypothetical protein